MTKNAMIKHRKNYTAINNSLLQDKNISWRAKGLLCELISYAEDTNFTTDDLMTNRQEKDIGLVFDELEAAGYISRRNDNIFDVFENPIEKNGERG